jgi:hypothetical protein
MPIPTSEIIAAAIDGLEAKKRHIDGQIAELRAMFTSSLPLDKGRETAIQPRRKAADAGSPTAPLGEGQR